MAQSNTIEEQFRSMRKRSVPLLGIETADPAKTIERMLTVTNGSPICQWDISRAMSGLNEPGIQVVSAICSGQDPRIATGNPAEFLYQIAGVPKKSVIFMHNAHRFLSEPAVVQGIWNLRDLYASKTCMLILLAPVLQLPAELRQDAIVISEPLPNKDELIEITGTLCTNAGIEPTDIEEISENLIGLSGFAAEQTVATSLVETAEGLDINRRGVWERKCSAIEQNQGLRIHRGRESFQALKGCDNITDFYTGVNNGRERPLCYVLIDEGEKQISSNEGDTTGVKGDQKATLLTFMQDKEVRGAIHIGVSGGGKSLSAKCAANNATVPLIYLDLGGTQSKWVGESEANLRNNLRVIEAISQGRMFFVLTSNDISAIPPEFKSRFTDGTFFFDLLSAEERKACFDVYLKQYGLEDWQIDTVKDEGWTGREIKACCRLAWTMNRKLSEVANFIVPVCKSDAERIKRLRMEATGKYISANYPGVYQMPPEIPGGRRFDL